MARNQFGAVCDKCGALTNIPKSFYRLVLPTYDTEFNNCVKTFDYCIECYEDLKITLAKHYNYAWALEKEKNNG